MYYELNHLKEMAPGLGREDKYRLLCTFCGSLICSDIPFSFKKEKREFVGMCGCETSELYMKKFSVMPNSPEKGMRDTFLLTYRKFDYLKPNRNGWPYGKVIETVKQGV